jgi:hypothetical protein
MLATAPVHALLAPGRAPTVIDARAAKKTAALFPCVREIKAAVRGSPSVHFPLSLDTDNIYHIDRSYLQIDAGWNGTKGTNKHHLADPTTLVHT